MQIKVFYAPRIHEALALVRESLGPDAVILDRVEAKDDAGRKIWRVHAALDDDAMKLVQSLIVMPAIWAGGSLIICPLWKNRLVSPTCR